MNWQLAYGLEYLLLLAGLILSFVMCWGVRKISPVLGLIEKPREDRISTRTVPMGGGLGWVLAFLLIVMSGCWWIYSTELPGHLETHRPGMITKIVDFSWICGGAAVLMLMGLFDDIRPVPMVLKLIVEFAIAITLAFQVPDALITAFVDQLEINRILTVLWIVVFINSINLLDHADGISSVTGMAIFIGLTVLAILSGQLFVGLISILLVGVLFGFFLHNYPPARLFMGDAGSLPLGYFVGVITALFTFYSDSREITTVFIPLCLLLVPIYDSTSVCWIRFKEKRPLWLGDKSHVSHRLLEKGWSPKRIVLNVFFLSLVGVGLSVSLYMLKAPYTYVVIALAFVLIFVMQRWENAA